MINLKKQDPVADAVRDILQQEALKGNQYKLDKNKNGKLDKEDFKILRKEESEQVDEAMGEKAAGDLDFINKVKGVAKKVGRVLGGPDDEGHKKDLQRKMGIPQTGKPNHAKYNEETEKPKSNWDKMMADVKAKRGPQPNGGSGKKQGSAYGGSKQTSKPEQEVNEAKRPEDDSVPFAPPYSKVPAETTDKSGAQHTPMSRAKHLARMAMGRVKKELGNKKGK